MSISFNNITQELAKIRRKVVKNNVLENTFAAKYLTDSGLIGDLSELKLPKLLKSPRCLSPIAGLHNFKVKFLF